MNAAQNPNQAPEVWYLDTSPQANVRKLFESHGYKVTEIKRGPELVAACEQLKGSTGELKVPNAVLLGVLDDLSDTQRGLIERLVGYGLENFVPLARSYLLNQDLLNWSSKERAAAGLGHIKIIGFGGPKHEGRPLVLFQFGTEDAEKHFGALEQATSHTPTLPYQARK